MQASQNCINIIEECEGFRSKPYLCPAGIPTIGYGSTQYADGSAITLMDIPISNDEAVTLLLSTLRRYVTAVNNFVKVPLSQNQFDALVDFTYNAGVGALQTSTLLKKLNSKDYVGASLEFAKWVHGGGKILPGLVKRRELEKALFLKAK